MTKLGHTQVDRKGRSQRERDFRPGNYSGVKLTNDMGLQLRFSAGARGGVTDFRIGIGLQDYIPIIEAMCKVDREGTLAKISSILADNLKRIEEERDEERKKERANTINQIRLPRGVQG